MRVHGQPHQDDLSERFGVTQELVGCEFDRLGLPPPSFKLVDVCSTSGMSSIWVMQDYCQRWKPLEDVGADIVTIVCLRIVRCWGRRVSCENVSDARMQLESKRQAEARIEHTMHRHKTPYRIQGLVTANPVGAGKDANASA